MWFLEREILFCLIESKPCNILHHFSFSDCICFWRSGLFFKDICKIFTVNNFKMTLSRAWTAFAPLPQVSSYLLSQLSMATFPVTKPLLVYPPPIFSRSLGHAKLETLEMSSEGREGGFSLRAKCRLSLCSPWEVLLMLLHKLQRNCIHTTW